MSVRRFYFDVVSPDGRLADEEGLEFADLDDAYLEACHSVADITRDLLLGHMRGDPYWHRFEILDHNRRLVLEVPFRELLNPKAAAPPQSMTAVIESLRANLARSQELKRAIAAELESARLSMGRIRERLAGQFSVADERQVKDR